MQRDPQDFDRVLSSMCTVPHPAARDAAMRFLSDNPGDPATYPVIAELEDDVVAMLGDIVGLDDPHGYVASGGTESNIQAVRAARNLADTDSPNVVAPESAHFSFPKAAEVLGVELRTVPTDADHRADLDAVAAAVDADTAMVVGVAGTTEFGRVDPVPALADLARDADALLHVDAAWGGFYLPFTPHEWSFAHADVDTMTVDPHKVGRAPVPAGGLLARDSRVLDALAVATPYLETRSQATLNGTRSGAGVAGAHAAIDAQWPTEYEDTYERQQANADWLAAELDARGYRVTDPVLPLVAADIPTREFDALRDRDWRISTTAAGETRFVLMPHVTRDTLARFLDDLDTVRD
ncbi:tyrosine decarboxylase MfnA [Halocalculus aciditolerans]|uniref:Probable L-aspartate decarboxylase n=1 Tax=Halocalculus aciditolerans TaxID=1383812 RepID=A0A830FAP0_9EURY|nr:tyrosine decarboxylase MfnA [Halocalculus aciditolerans]GGL70890.1 tyrosine decarboxylase MfnA [Halocalculus aciditolerans]